MDRSAVNLSVIGPVALAVLTSFPLLAGAAPPGNTKAGSNALKGNTGSYNTAVGFQAMDPNGLCTGPAVPNPCCTDVGKGSCGNSGVANVAVGRGALQSNTTAVGNTAVGDLALQSNTTASGNAALGALALTANTTGDLNTALGAGALFVNTTGANNTAVGNGALQATTTGGTNTAVGQNALAANTTGVDNTAVGREALQSNIAGVDNTAVGQEALFSCTGFNNIGIGNGAGFNLAGGGNNIDIGNAGSGAESNTIRIGDPALQTAAFVAGIRNGVGNGSGVAVYVDNTGQLSPTVSSARFKQDIRDMGDASSKLLQLRPVTFRYKKTLDPSGLEQYGLVAEEVAKVYPDLVVYDDDGKPQTVRYHFINAMLLNEVQKQARQIQAQRQQIEDQTAHVKGLTTQIEALMTRLVQVEAALGTPGRVPPVEASYKGSPGL